MNNPATSNLVTIEFYTQSNAINGQISCPNNVRILDFLNGSGILDPYAKGDFVEFTNAGDQGIQYQYPDRPKEYIRKAAVQLVAISDANLGRGTGASDNRNLFPFVQKSPVWVNLQLQNYTLIGTVHLDQKQTTQGLLNDDSQFLPLTEVTIAREYHLYGTRPFVAVNKQHIISLREEPAGWIPKETHTLTSHG